MLKQVLLVVLFAAVIMCRSVRQAQPEEVPSPYSFNSQTQDENGTIFTRSESGDANGVIQGTYGYQDPISGYYRLVTYVADPVNGFNAKVETNEPGTKTSNPAGVEVISTQQRR